MKGSRISDADVTDVTGACLAGADLRGADLRHVVGLTISQLSDAILDATTILPSYLNSVSLKPTPDSEG